MSTAALIRRLEDAKFRRLNVHRGFTLGRLSPGG